MRHGFYRHIKNFFFVPYWRMPKDKSETSFKHVATAGRQSVADEVGRKLRA